MKFLPFLLRTVLTVIMLNSTMLVAENVPATIQTAVELRFNAASGSIYEIQGSADLNVWTNVETGILGNDAEVARFYSTANLPLRFFQVSTITIPTGFSLIPAGNFTMGDSIEADTVFSTDAPPHEVMVSAFYMAQNPVTKAEWDTVRSRGLSNGYTDLAIRRGKDSNHPIASVTWFDCIKYCNARSEMEGLTPVYTVGGVVMKTGTAVPAVNWGANGYRLPTEAEWEKAARGGLRGKRFPLGDTISHSLANYYGSTTLSYDLSGVDDYHPNSSGDEWPATLPVGSFAPNGYGLKDMAGNIRQWCWDWYGDYITLPSTDPRGAASGFTRVLRGGSYYDTADLCRAAFRSSESPSYSADNESGSPPSYGFRIARGSAR